MPGRGDRKCMCLRKELAWHAQCGAEEPVSLKHREQEGEWLEVTRNHTVSALLVAGICWVTGIWT